MLDQRRVAAQPDEKREQLFTERYESLLAWALRLTNQQREAAEDLVQDAFVQFMLGRTRLEEIENIDGYLRRMLRYMHVARMSRSTQVVHEGTLSVADYDTCQLGWRAIEPPRRVQASEELHGICTYACSRKETSKAGSVLILRFFLDFFPSEIARILNSSRHSVDELQRFARREAKLFMNQPRRLHFVDGKGASERPRIKYLKSDCDLMLELRRMIFASCKGECLSQHEFEDVYGQDNTDALTTTKLAHIVSCPKCLDVANSLLGLPLLAERYRTEPSNNEPPRDDGHGGGESGGGTSGGSDLSRKLGHRLRETHEHKPQELRISVNGFLVSSFKVSSDLSELDLNLTGDDPIQFVEVSSEQGVQLLFFSVNPLAPEGEQWAWIKLSEGRSLEACFQTENGSSLRVVYKDPLPEEAVNVETNSLSSPLFVVPVADELPSPNVSTQPVRTWTRRVVDVLRRLTRRRLAAEDTATHAGETLIQSLQTDRNNEPQFLTLLTDDGKHRRRRFALVVVLVSAAVAAAFLFLKASMSPELTAMALLDRAVIAEQSAHQLADTVRHRYIRLEERRSTEGAVVAQRKIEIWESGAAGNRSQRLFDDSNKLIAGAWQRPDGSRTIYHHGSKPRPEPALTSPDNLLLNLQDVWQLEPSAKTFRALVGELADVTMDERSTTYVLSYDKVRTIGASRLLKATLTLSKSDLHSIEQTLLVERGNDLREYRFVEASLELVPLKAVAPTAFEVEPELIGGAEQFGRPGDWAPRDLTSSRVPPSPSTSAPPPASAELEVDVAYLLNQAKADRNEQVALTRSAGGSLRVEGVVDTQQRREEFLRALGPVINNPAVTIAIRTVAEATARPTPVGPVVVQETEETANSVAAEEELRTYFSRASGGPTNDAIRSYSSRVVNRAYRALFHAIEMQRLVSRFASVDMRTISPDARAKWLTMLGQHATAFAAENAALQQEIEPVFFAGSAAQVRAQVTVENDADLARAVEQLHKLALSNNEAIRAGLTTSARSSAVALKSIAFWQSLQRVENLARAIMQYQSASNRTTP